MNCFLFDCCKVFTLNLGNCQHDCTDIYFWLAIFTRMMVYFAIFVWWLPQNDGYDPLLCQQEFLVVQFNMDVESKPLNFAFSVGSWFEGHSCMVLCTCAITNMCEKSLMNEVQHHTWVSSLLFVIFFLVGLINKRISILTNREEVPTVLTGIDPHPFLLYWVTPTEKENEMRKNINKNDKNKMLTGEDIEKNNNKKKL